MNLLLFVLICGELYLNEAAWQLTDSPPLFQPSTMISSILASCVPPDGLLAFHSASHLRSVTLIAGVPSVLKSRKRCSHCCWWFWQPHRLLRKPRQRLQMTTTWHSQILDMKQQNNGDDCWLSINEEHPRNINKGSRFIFGRRTSSHKIHSPGGSPPATQYNEKSKEDLWDPFSPSTTVVSFHTGSQRAFTRTCQHTSNWFGTWYIPPGKQQRRLLCTMVEVRLSLFVWPLLTLYYCKKKTRGWWKTNESQTTT